MKKKWKNGKEENASKYPVTEIIIELEIPYIFIYIPN